MDDLFESEFSFEGLFQAAVQGTEFENSIESQLTDNSDYPPIETAMQATQLQSPTKRQHADDVNHDDTAGQLTNSPKKRRRTNDAQVSMLPASTNAPSIAPSPVVNEVIEIGRSSRPTDAALKQKVQLNNEMYTRFKRDVKEYMTDDAFPERLTTVGAANSSDSQGEVKRRMSRVAEHFLNAGYGAKYFARGVPNHSGPTRDIFWPEDSEAITEAVKPSLRQAVTNHRTKLNGRAKKAARAASPFFVASPAMMSPPVTDPLAAASPSGLETTVQVFANIVREQDGEYRRLVPRLLLDSTLIVSFAEVLRQLRAKMSDSAIVGAFPFLAMVDVCKCKIKAFGMKGLVDINDENDWMLVLLNVEGAEWMDSELRILVIV